MLYPKVTQRYLAAIVSCLMVILGISTLLFVYSFYLRRSPLLVERLDSMMPNVYSGKLSDNRLQNTIIHNQAVNAKKYFDGNEDKNISNIINNKTNKTNIGQLNPSDIPYWESKKNSTNSVADNFSDTIYIDDFERNKSKFFTIEKPTFEDPPASISYPKSSHEAITVERIRKIENTPLHQISNRRFLTKKIKIQHELNLDEDDDDVDDLNASYGSGSGDFGSRADIEEDRIYDMQIITDFSKDWVDYGRLTRFNSKKYKGNHQNKKKQNKNVNNYINIGKDNNTEDKKLMKTWSKGQKRSDHFNSGSTFASKVVAKFPKNQKERLAKQIKNEHAAAKIPYQANKLLSTTTGTKERPSLHYNNKNQEIIITRMHKAERASDLNDSRQLSKSTLPHSERERDNDLSLKYDYLFNKPTVKDPQMNPATWVETRTRRVLGNVRKSEERSRQLLLCEEAGGGELCRMLFKGHKSK